MSIYSPTSQPWSGGINAKSTMKGPGLKDSSRDRTGEFMSTVESIGQRRHHATRYSCAHRPSVSNQNVSPFGQAAIQIGTDLGTTSLKLGKLTLLVKRDGPPQDRSNEINQLRGIIKQDIGTLNRQLGQMQDLLKQNRRSCVSQQQHSHLATVVVTLQSKLVTISTGFKETLELEQKMQKMSTPRHQSTSPEMRYNGSPQQGDGDVAIDMSDLNSGGGGGTVQNRFHNSSQQQQIFIVEEAEIRQRDNSMQSIEQTIVELGEIFNQLSYMVKEQEEVTNRIDHNIDTASFNIEDAHSQLVKYLKGVSSTRGFMLKVFIVLIVFFILVMFFFT